MSTRGSRVWGGILIGLGILMLLSALHINLFSLVIPIGLVVLGAWIVYRKSHPEESKQTDARYTYNADQGVYTATVTSRNGSVRAEAKVHGHGSEADSSARSERADRANEAGQVFGDKVKYSKFLGDMLINCENVNLQNVEISSFVGDVEVILSGGKLQPGLNRMIISGFLGDCLVLIPRDMAVHVHCSGFIGDVELLGKRSSGFGNTIDSQTPEYDSSNSKLYIAVNNFIGDIRVYRV